MSLFVDRFLAPLFLAMVLTLGGASRESFVANGVLQLVAIVAMLWCLWDRRLQRLSGWAYAGIALFVVFMLTCLAGLIPLPPELWSALPGRQIVADGFHALAQPLPWLSYSLAPEETIYGLLKFLPPAAAFLVAAKCASRTFARDAAWTLLIVAFLSVAIGLGQVFGGRSSPLYFYDVTNLDYAVGFMANVNHQATLLLMTLPFAVALAFRLKAKADAGGGDPGQMVLLGAIIVVIALGIAIAGSVAGYIIALPALVMSLLAVRRQSDLSALIAIPAATAVLALLILVVMNSPWLTGLGITEFSNGSQSRTDTYTRTMQAIADSMPAGTGLGSFEYVFPHYEDTLNVSRTFMNHAHNDYLELVLELGAVGALWLVCGLGWILAMTVSVWRRDRRGDAILRRAASVALLVVILHSVVDYPLRTSAIGTLAALCLGLMAASPIGGKTEKGATPNSGNHITI